LSLIHSSHQEVVESSSIQSNGEECLGWTGTLVSTLPHAHLQC